MGLSTQVPFTQEISSNFAPALIRKMTIKNRQYIIRRPVVEITEENAPVLQSLLSRAGVPHGKSIQEKESPAVLQKDSAMSETETAGEQFIIPETITQKHAQYFYSFFKGRKDVYRTGLEAQ